MQSNENPNLDVILYLVFYLMYTIGLLFLYCEFGQQIVNRFNTLYDDTCQFKWEMLPLGLQKSWLIVLAATQQPVQLVGFGNIISCRETFQRVNFLLNYVIH